MPPYPVYMGLRIEPWGFVKLDKYTSSLPTERHPSPVTSEDDFSCFLRKESIALLWHIRGISGWLEAEKIRQRQDSQCS